MKRNLVALVALTVTLTANAGWFGSDEKVVQAAPAPAAPAPHPYAMKTAAAPTAVTAPAWFTRMPEDTPDMLFSAGTASSLDEQMAYDKARLQAERKLVEMMTARVRSNTKSYRADTGDTMSERMEVTINKTADGELIGAQRVDSRATFDGRTYKVYVLLRYPLAENNGLRKEREQAKAKRETELRAARAQQDLERANETARAEAERADAKMKQEIGPRAEPVPPAVKGPDTVSTSGGEIKLLDVDNTEYKSKRAEALAKPGAVIGQTVIQTN
jgi:hypothetical protein